jgi:hypothetical protein
MPSFTVLGLNDIAIAYSFIADCADEDPREFGVDFLPAYSSRHHGVFEASLDTEENLAPS